MGSTGLSIELRGVRGRERAGRRDLHRAVTGFFVSTWQNALSSRHSKHAAAWMGAGADSLVSFVGRDEDDDESAPADRLVFWFDLSVTWSTELARHWIDLALAHERKELDAVLRRLSYVATGGHLPTPDTARGAFLVSGARIAHVHDDRATWQFPDVDDVPLASLGPQLRKRAEAVRAGAAPCECPYCERVRRRNAPGR